MSRNAPLKWIEVDSAGVGWEVTVVHPGGTDVYDQYDDITREQLPIKVTNFSCPACGGQKFDPVTSRDSADIGMTDFSHMVIGPPSGPSTTTIRIIDYMCTKCTAKFADPAAFSKNQPPEIVAPVVTPPT